MKAVCRWRSWPGGALDTLRYGPLKPVGLADPKTGEEPYAVVQLRQGQCRRAAIYNLVGFQTHLRFPEQKRVFSMIPALRECGVCPLRRDAPQYLSWIPRGCWTGTTG